MKINCDDEYTQKFFSEINLKINRFQRPDELQPEINIPPLYEWIFQSDKRTISTPKYSVNEVVIKFGTNSSLMIRYLYLDKYNAPTENLNEILWDDEFPKDVQSVIDYLIERPELPIAESYIRYLWRRNREMGDQLTECLNSTKND